ncbi:VOC family protein [Bacillus timonensis]|uniref:VOC family protein n=1 Tax=Bacillus timonensis TaxID=1033734 RepID=A0A4V3V7K5_9BACI|nr:VOC family protein [Bacillus timonensis]THE11793.1 VOC family protein [Bacillus timonensis]
MLEIRFDHVVHYVKDPHAPMAAFQLLGFHPVKGGNHDNWGTYNTLCYFKKVAYIEWIGIHNLDVTREGNHPFSSHLYKDYQLGEGLSQIAFRTSSIKKVQLHLAEKGVKTLGPYPGSRKRPDGTLLKWSMLFIEESHPMPFFIEWGEENEVRVKDLVTKGLYIPDGKRISYIGYSVKEPEITAKQWSDLFKGTISDTVLPGTEQYAFKVHFDSIEVYFCNEDHPRGERPYRIGIEPSKGKTIQLHGATYKL